MVRKGFNGILVDYLIITTDKIQRRYLPNMELIDVKTHRCNNHVYKVV